MELHGICIAFPMPIILKHKTGGKEEATSIKWETVNAIEKQYIHGHKIKKKQHRVHSPKMSNEFKTISQKTSAWTKSAKEEERDNKKRVTRKYSRV